MSTQPSGPNPANAWPEPHGFRPTDSASPASQSGPGGGGGPGGVMSWPSNAGAASANAWPAGGNNNAGGVQEWPTWTPSDASQTTAPGKKGQPQSGPPKKAGKQGKAMPEGPSPEERAQKAAAEEALLSELEDAIARRVRLLRRLDPDTPIEKLIDKARQGQAEAATAPQAKEDKSSSWWRRK